MARLVIGTSKAKVIPAIVAPSNVVDEFANYVDLGNIINCYGWVESTELTTACNQISQFLFGTNNS